MSDSLGSGLGTSKELRDALSRVDLENITDIGQLQAAPAGTGLSEVARIAAESGITTLDQLRTLAGSR